MFKNNHVESVTRSLGEVLRWQWQRKRAGFPLYSRDFREIRERYATLSPK